MKHKLKKKNNWYILYETKSTKFLLEVYVQYSLISFCLFVCEPIFLKLIFMFIFIYLFIQVKYVLGCAEVPQQISGPARRAQLRNSSASRIFIFIKM